MNFFPLAVEHNSVTILFQSPNSLNELRPGCCNISSSKCQSMDDTHKSSSNHDNEAIVINPTLENSKHFQKLLSYKKQQLMSRARIKTYRMSAIIILFFIICWLPYWIYYVLVTLKMAGLIEFTLRKHIWIFVFIQSLASLNSAFNPIIYGLLNRNFFRFLMRKKANRHERRRQLQFQ